MKYIFVLLLFLGQSSNLLGQDSINHYKKQLSIVNDNDKLFYLNKLYWEYYSFNIDSAYGFAQEGYNLSKKLQNTREEYGFLLCLAHYSGLVGNSINNIKFSERAVRLTEVYSEVDSLRGLAYLAAGFAIKKVNPKKALYYFTKVKNGEWKNDWLNAKGYHALGKLYLLLEDQTTAKKNIHHSIFIYDTIKNKISINDPLFDISSILLEETNYDSALFYIQKIISNTSHAENKFFKLKAEQLKFKVFLAKQDYNLCLNLLDSLKADCQKLKTSNFISSKILISEAITYIHLKEYEKAISILTPVYQSAKERNNEEILIKSSDLLANAYLSINKYNEALILKNNINETLKDSLQSIKNILKNDVEELFNYMQERDSLQLAQNNERILFEKEKSKQDYLQKNTFIVLIFISFLTIILIYYYQLKHKVNLKLKVINEELTNSYNEINEANEEIATLNNTLELQVRNRTRDLKNRNKKLERYADYNSHVLRAPIVRFLGLINLLKRLDDNSSEKEVILNHLYSSSEDLELITRDMQNLLNSDLES